MDLKTTRYEIVEGGVAVITLSRPKRRNAWTGRMHTEYRWLLSEADADKAVRVIVVTGDPEGQAFCAGADLGALEGHSIRTSMRRSPTTSGSASRSSRRSTARRRGSAWC